MPMRSPAGFAAAAAPRTSAPPPDPPRAAGGVRAVRVLGLVLDAFSSGRSPPRELDFIARLCFFHNHSARKMSTQILPASSLRSVIQLPAGRARFLAPNYLICVTLWSIG